MPTERKTAAAPVIVVAVLVLVVLPMLYVLSVGPAAALLNRGTLSPAVGKVLEGFYYPLLLAVNTWPPAGEALVWYMKLWVPEVQ